MVSLVEHGDYQNGSGQQSFEPQLVTELDGGANSLYDASYDRELNEAILRQLADSGATLRANGADSRDAQRNIRNIYA